MYLLLLTVHSTIRWLLLITLKTTLWVTFWGWKRKGDFNQRHFTYLNFLTALAIIQLLLGVIIYCLSPMTEAFWSGLPQTIKIRPLRFFAIEHSTSMAGAIILLIAAALLARKASSDLLKFKVTGLCCALSMIIIITSIPWEFSPFVSRPHFRHLEILDYK